MVGGPLCLLFDDSLCFVTITPRMLPTSRAITTIHRTIKASAQTGRKPHTFCFAIVFHFFSAGFSDSASAAAAASPLRTGSPLCTESVDRGDVGSMGEMARFSEENSGLRVARPIPPAPEAAAGYVDGPAAADGIDRKSVV